MKLEELIYHLLALGEKYVNSSLPEYQDMSWFQHSNEVTL